MMMCISFYNRTLMAMYITLYLEDKFLAKSRCVSAPCLAESNHPSKFILRHVTVNCYRTCHVVLRLMSHRVVNVTDDIQVTRKLL